MEIFQQFIEDYWVFIALFILAILILIGWKRYHTRQQDELSFSDQDLYTDDYFYESELNNLDQNELNPNTHVGQPKMGNEPTLATENTSTNIPQREEKNIEEPSTDSNENHPKELIIALNVRALREEGFKGTDIFDAMEELNIEHGDMGIFHHYGIEKEATYTPVFSIANLLKPGIFDPAEQERFYTPGLIAFMQLPGPLGGRVALELMLHYTQRLAQILHGQLEDDRKQVVDIELINFMRQSIDKFEKRSFSSKLE